MYHENAKFIPVTLLIFDYIYLYVVSFRLHLLYHLLFLQYWICNGKDIKNLAHILTIHGSNCYQDIRQNHWNLIK